MGEGREAGAGRDGVAAPSRAADAAAVDADAGGETAGNAASMPGGAPHEPSAALTTSVVTDRTRKVLTLYLTP